MEFEYDKPKKALCDNCGKFIEVKYKKRSIKISKNIKICGILVGVCNECNEMVVLPHDSNKEVRRQLNLHFKK